MDRMALGQVVLQVLHSLPVRISSLMVHLHSFIDLGRYIK